MKQSSTYQPVQIPGAGSILPSLALIYRSKVERLIVALNVPEERGAAADFLRPLIDRIVLTPCEGSDEMLATIHGEYTRVLQWLAEHCKQTKTPLAFASRVCVSGSDRLQATALDGVAKLVAGGRNQGCRYLIKLTEKIRKRFKQQTNHIRARFN